MRSAECGILCNISRSLKPQAKAVFTVLNALASIRKNTNKDVEEGRFDPLTLVESSECPPREGLAAVAVRERTFVPKELALLFRLAGMSVINIWGGTAGNWGRRPVDLAARSPSMLEPTSFREPAIASFLVSFQSLSSCQINDLMIT